MHAYYMLFFFAWFYGRIGLEAIFIGKIRCKFNLF